MPHFVVECSDSVIRLKLPDAILKAVHDATEGTGLFAPGDIKVRIHPYALQTVAGSQGDFIHVFGHIMQGRTEVQKRDLSTRILRTLAGMFPEVPVISMNVIDFERSTYCNRTMI